MDITPYLAQSIGWAPRSGINAAGEATYDAVQTLAARVENRPARARQGAEGTEAQSSTEIWVATVVAEGDRVWLPGANTANARESREILQVEAVPDLDGVVSYYKVAL